LGLRGAIAEVAQVAPMPHIPSVRILCQLERSRHCESMELLIQEIIEC
jgi:hypothetical protein